MSLPFPVPDGYFGSLAETQKADAGPPTGAALFLKLWNETKDSSGSCVFTLASGFRDFGAWTRLWAERPWPDETMRRAFRNIADGVSRGVLERRYIPRHPDRLAADLARYLDAPKSPNGTADANVRREAFG